jgi:hypothetical protein
MKREAPAFAGASLSQNRYYLLARTPPQFVIVSTVVSQLLCEPLTFPLLLV